MVLQTPPGDWQEPAPRPRPWAAGEGQAPDGPPRRGYREEEAGNRCRFPGGGIGCDSVTWPRFYRGEGGGEQLRRRRRRAAGMSAAEGWPRSRWGGGGGGGEAVLRARAEAAGYRRLLRARAAEVEALRGAVGALHRQLEGLRDRRSGELAKYQERVAELEREIGEAEAEMARCLREYPALLRLRMALEAEIAAYRYAGAGRGGGGGSGGAGGARGSARACLLQGDAGGRRAASGLSGPAVTGHSALLRDLPLPGPARPRVWAPRPRTSAPRGPLSPYSPAPPDLCPRTPRPRDPRTVWTPPDSRSPGPSVPLCYGPPRTPGTPGSPGSPDPRPGSPRPPRRAALTGPHTLTSLSGAAAGLWSRPQPAQKHLNKAPWHYPEPARLWWWGSVHWRGPVAVWGSAAEPGPAAIPWETGCRGRVPWGLPGCWVFVPS
uniref:IF rod domain-containing protein n=1 Tax=Calidris pygmaea TaxID=425635 RepID=A0A8C3PRG7_9CHAR